MMDHSMTSEDDQEVIPPIEDSSSSYEASVSSNVVDESQSEDIGPSSEPAQEMGTGSASRTPSRASQWQPKGKKRKATMQEARKAKAARMQGLYSNEYRKLLNSDIADATAQMLAQERDPLHQSQNGVTIWTSEEKQMLFTALGRLGKDNVEAIATRIGTKSALEVREYTQLLHRGMIEHNMKDARYGLAGLSDFPSAMHISQDCEYELERAADVLAFRQERYEDGVEEKKWGSLPWLLDSKANILIEGLLADKDESQALRINLPSAELLNLGNFLNLSSGVFMNPAPPFEDGNWRFLAEADEEEPGMRTTAFEDFGRLVISVTKRLVSATLFCAMSRLRATDSKAFHVRPIVKTVDVEAAAKTIGMALNSDKFWSGCPRRCHLNVYKRKDDPTPMNYNLLESMLDVSSNTQPSQDRNKDIPASSESSYASSESEISETEPAEINEEFDSELDTAPKISRNLASEYLSLITPPFSYHTSAIDPSDSEFSTSAKHIDRETKRLRVTEAAETSQNEYAELLDMRASLAEEQRLWTTVLKKEPPFSIEVEDVQLPEEEPVLERKDEDELGDWRERVEFWSHWERLEKPVNEAPSRMAVGRTLQKILTGEEDAKAAEMRDQSGNDASEK